MQARASVEARAVQVMQSRGCAEARVVLVMQARVGVEEARVVVPREVQSPTEEAHVPHPVTKYDVLWPEWRCLFLVHGNSVRPMNTTDTVTMKISVVI